MQLKRVQIKDFLAVKKADVDLSTAPVHVFLGPHKAAKASFRDAIKFAFTGICPGLPKRRADKLAVTVGTGAGDITRTVAECSLKERDLASLFGPPESLEASLSGFRFLDMSPAGRRTLVGELCGASAGVPDAVRKLAQEAGLSVEDANALGSVAEKDLDDCENLATSRRQALERQLEDQGEPPAASVTLNGKTFNLAKVTADQIKAQLTVRERERDEVMRARVAGAARPLDKPEIIAEKLHKLGKEIEANNITEAAFKAIKDAADSCADKVKAVQSSVDVAEGKLQAARQRFKDLETTKNVCLVCAQPITPAHLTKLVNDSLEAGEAATQEKLKAQEKVDKAQELYNVAQAAYLGAQERWRKRDVLSAEYRDLGRDLKEAERLEGLQAKAGALDQAVATGKALLEAKARLAEYELVDKGREDGMAAIRIWDKVAQELGKNGRVRKPVGGGFDLATVQEAANTLLGVRLVEVDEAWNIYLGGVPAELLSPSARFRLGAAFSAAFAIAGGLKILFLDEADVLEPTKRKELSAWVHSLAGKIDTALIFSTSSTKPPAGGGEDWVKMWWVEAGEVAPV